MQDVDDSPHVGSLLAFLDDVKATIDAAVAAGIAEPSFSQTYLNNGAALLEQIRSVVARPSDIELPYTALRTVMRARRVGSVLIAPDGEVKFSCLRARSLIGTYFPQCSLEDGQLPDVVANWVEERRRAAQTLEEDQSTRRFITFLREGARLIIRIYPVSEMPGWDALHMREYRSDVSGEHLGGLGLSLREAEIMALVAQGKTNREIGALLDLSHRTVQTHLRHIFKRYDLENRSAAAIWALRMSNRMG